MKCGNCGHEGGPHVEFYTRGGMPTRCRGCPECERLEREEREKRDARKIEEEG